MAFGDAVQQIKDRLNIIDVVSPYVELHKAGRHFKGKSPFTNEKTPSFFVSPERGMYYCFSTSQGGDIFKFIEVMEGVDFKEALKILAAKAGVELVPENPAQRTEREELYQVIEVAAKFFEKNLAATRPALDYLERRSVAKETVSKWRIGYAPGPPEGGWRELRQYLSAQGFKDELMLKAGLIKNTDSGKEPFDVFRGRVMFPLRDQNGKVVAFSGRILAKDSEAPKYVNSPDTALYHKSELLYGYDLAKHNIRQLGFWLIVEGQFDVVMSHQAGYTNTVAVSGTALTLDHVKLLERLSTKVVLALDADRAGIAAMKRAAELMLRRGMDVKVATLPNGSDPADLVAASGIKEYKQAVGGAVHVIEFLLAHITNTVADDRARKLRVRDEVIPFILLIPDRIDQEHFEGVVAESLRTTKDAIHFEVTRLEEASLSKTHAAAGSGSADSLPPASSTGDTHNRREAVMMQVIAAYDIEGEENKKVLAEAFLSIVGQSLSAKREEFDQSQLQQIIFQLEKDHEKTNQRVWREELVYMLNQLRQKVLKDRLAEIRARLTAEEEGSEELITALHELQKQLQAPPYEIGIFDAPGLDIS